jgi:Tol biopolymer transport system component
MSRGTTLGWLLGLAAVVVAFGIHGVLARSSGPFQVAPAKPMPNVLVYAQPVGPCCQPSSKPEQIWVAATDGTHKRLLTEGQAPSVSPDGRYVAYDSDAKVLVIPTAGGDTTTVATGLYPGWAPNSRYLAYYGIPGLVVVDVKTGTTVTTIARQGNELPDGFAFSPDSQRIAYTFHGDLYVVPITGGGSPVRLTDDHKTIAPVWGKLGLAFSRFTKKAHSDIWLSDGTKHQLRQLTHTGADTWPAYFSVSGTELLAANPANHNGRLWAVDVKTGVERPITDWVGDLVPQGLTSDGSTVLAAIGCGATASPFGSVETIPFAGGTPLVIVHGPCRASWNAG